MNFYARDGAPLRRARYAYLQGTPLPGVTAIHPYEGVSCPFEGGAPPRCGRDYLAYDPFFLLVAHARSGTIDIPGEPDLYHYFRYSLDSTNWLFRPLASWRKRADAAGVDVVLDMRRITYDTAAGKSTHVVKRERILFDDAESATCTVIDDPWNPNRTYGITTGMGGVDF